MLFHKAIIPVKVWHNERKKELYFIMPGWGLITGNIALGISPGFLANLYAVGGDNAVWTEWSLERIRSRILGS